MTANKVSAPSVGMSRQLLGAPPRDELVATGNDMRTHKLTSWHYASDNPGAPKEWVASCGATGYTTGRLGSVDHAHERMLCQTCYPSDR